MRTKEFKERIGKRYKKIIDDTRSVKGQFGFNQRNLVRQLDCMEALKELTGDLDFGCNFNKEGLCRSYADFKTKKRNMCCCGSCQGATGHLSTIRQSRIPQYARLFSKKTGFWREGKGCILPRALRSATCVTYTCIFLDEQGKNDKEFKKLENTLGGIRAGLSHLHKQISDSEERIRQISEGR